MNATVFTQKENTINGCKVWLYLVSSSIGHIIVVDYEVAGEKTLSANCLTRTMKRPKLISIPFAGRS